MLGKLFSGKHLIAHDVQIPLSFRLAGERSLYLSPTNAAEIADTWRYLSHNVKRYPHDLRNHVQRILLSRTETMAERLAGSLLDLFLALGNAGHPLKETMLNLIGDQLTEEQRHFFEDWSKHGQTEVSRTRWMTGSILSTGESTPARTLLVQQRNQSHSQYDNLLAEIQDYLEYGQIDLAQDLLETEILEGRSTPELEEELVIIYQHTRNKTRLIEVADTLIAAEAGVTSLWIKAREEAENW